MKIWSQPTNAIVDKEMSTLPERFLWDTILDELAPNYGNVVRGDMG